MSCVESYEYIRIRLLSKNSFWSLMFWGIFTTFPHELAHYLIALFTGARPKGLSLIPKKYQIENQTFWVLGQVEAYVNKINGVFIGLAPILWLFVGYFITKYFFYYFEFNLLNTIVFYIIIYLCIINGIPSIQDLRVVFDSHWWLIIILIGGYFLWKNIIFI